MGSDNLEKTQQNDEEKSGKFFLFILPNTYLNAIQFQENWKHVRLSRNNNTVGRFSNRYHLMTYFLTTILQ